MSNTTTTTTTAPVAGDNSKVPGSAIIMSAGDIIGSVGEVYKRSEHSLYTAWQTILAVVYKLCELQVTLPADYEIDGGKSSRGEAALSLDELAKGEGPAKTRNPVYAGLAYYIGHHMDAEYQTASHILKFGAMLIKRGYTLADWNGKIIVDGSRMTTEVAEYVDGMPIDQTPGAWRLRFRDVASKPSAIPPVPYLVETDATPIRLAKARMAGSLVVYDEVPNVDRICLVGDKAYHFMYGAVSEATGMRPVLPSVRIGRDSFIRVGQAQIDYSLHVIAEAEKARKAAEATAKAAKDATEAAAKADAEAKARGEKVVEPLTEEKREALEAEANKPDANKPDADAKPDAETPKPDAPASKPDDTASKPEATDNGKPANGKPEDAPKVATDAETQNQMRVADERTRGDAEKQAEAWTPEKVAEFVLKNFVAPRMKEDAVWRREATRMFTHLAGQISIMSDEGKMLVAQPANPTKAKEFMAMPIVRGKANKSR